MTSQQCPHLMATSEYYFSLLLCSFSLSLSLRLTSGFQIYPPFLNRVISISAIVVNQLSLRLSGIAFHFISPLWFNEMKINPISFLLKNIFSANELGRTWMRPRLEAYFSPRRHSMPNLMHFNQSHFDWSDWHTKNLLRPIFISFGLIYLNYILDALVAVLQRRCHLIVVGLISNECMCCARFYQTKKMHTHKTSYCLFGNKATEQKLPRPR